MGGVGGKFNLVVEEWFSRFDTTKLQSSSKVLGRLPFLPVLFLPPPAPALFCSGLKWTTVKLYNLPNYCCLWLSENSGCGRKRSKIGHFLSVETSSKNTRKQYSVEKNYLPYLVKTVFGAHACLYSACFANRQVQPLLLPGHRKRAKIQMYDYFRWKLLTIAWGDMLQILKQDIVRSPVPQNIIRIATLQLTSSLAVPPFFQHSAHANLPREQTMRVSGDLPNSRGHFFRLNNSN